MLVHPDLAADIVAGLVDESALTGLLALDRALVVAEVAILRARTRLRDPAGTGSGTVYLIAGADKVKVGFTGGDPNDRLSALQTGSPVPLELLDCFKGELRDERALHMELWPHRSHGEWFFRSPDLCVLFADIGNLPLRRSPYRPVVQ